VSHPFVILVDMEQLPSVEEIAVMHGRDLDAALWACEQARRELEATIAAITARCEQTMHHLDDGHRTVKAWSMAVTNCSPAEAHRRRSTARALELVPGIRDAFRAATVGVAQVGELARLAANPRAREHLAGSQDVLLDAARTLPFEDYKLVIDRWLLLADPDGAAQRAARTHAQRNASLTDVGDGEFQWRTSHGAIDADVMQQVFDAFCDAEFHADWDACVAEHGLAACVALLPRTARQRRADALTAIFEAAATAGIGGVPIGITLNLLMDQDQYEQRLTSAIDGTHVDIDPATVRERRSETTAGVPVDPNTIVALSVLAHVRRIVVDGAGIVVNAGMKRRLFDGALAEVIKAIEPRCRWLGCIIRAAIAQIDHLTDFTAGGPTDAANGVVMCEHHNLFKYRSRYRPRRQPDDTWHIHRPDGSIITGPDAA
jgi:hypothetical protein